jgi:hypothetical protein
MWLYAFLFVEGKALLYLDSDLVERAKKENIDISRLTEEALKEALEVVFLGQPRPSANNTRISWV